MRNPVLHGKKQWGGGGGERTLGPFVKSFLPAVREKQHRIIFSHHTGRLENFSPNGGYVILARSHSIVLGHVNFSVRLYSNIVHYRDIHSDINAVTPKTSDLIWVYADHSCTVSHD